MHTTLSEIYGCKTCNRAKLICKFQLQKLSASLVKLSYRL